MALGKCCCCVELRTGAITIAILGFVAAFVNLAAGLGWHNVCFLILRFVASGLLLYGAHKREKVPTIIYLVLDMISQVLIAIITILDIVAISDDSIAACLSPDVTEDACFAAMEVIAFYIAIYAGAFSLSIYFWICIFSFLKELEGATSSSSLVAMV